MGVKVKRYAATADPVSDPIAQDTTREQREVTVDGQTYHFGLNEQKNFLDEGVGAAVGRFAPGSNVTEVTREMDSRF